MKEGEPCDLLEQLAAEPAFSMHKEDLAVLLRPEAYIGRCPEQVDTSAQGTPAARRHFRRYP